MEKNNFTAAFVLRGLHRFSLRHIAQVLGENIPLGSGDLWPLWLPFSLSSHVGTRDVLPYLVHCRVLYPGLSVRGARRPAGAPMSPFLCSDVHLPNVKGRFEELCARAMSKSSSSAVLLLTNFPFGTPLDFRSSVYIIPFE